MGGFKVDPHPRGDLIEYCDLLRVDRPVGFTWNVEQQKRRSC